MDEIKLSETYMSRAVKLARKGLGRVLPNPPVGCVIVSKDGEIISEGYHTKFGAPHAEAEALLKIKNKDYLKDATVYVTLEPCAHEGKTPSCAKTLAEFPVKKVVYAEADPNPLVNGQGLQILKQAGIAVEKFETENESLKEEIISLAEIFKKNFSEKKTFISLKLGMSLDAKIALSSGESSWITNEESRKHVHFLRSQHDAIMVGGRTLLADNPKLNIRLDSGDERANKLLVYDPNGTALTKLTGEENIFKVRDKSEIYWLVNKKLNLQKGSVQEALAQVEINWNDLPSQLFGLGIYALFIEGGAFVASEFLKSAYVDRLHLFVAPFIIGKSPFSWSAGLQLDDIKSRMNFTGAQSKNFGNDTYLSLRYPSNSF